MFGGRGAGLRWGVVWKARGRPGDEMTSNTGLEDLKVALLDSYHRQFDGEDVDSIIMKEEDGKDGKE